MKNKFNHCMLAVVLGSISTSIFAEMSDSQVVTFSALIPSKCGINVEEDDGILQFSDSIEEQKGVSVKIIGNVSDNLTLAIPEIPIEDVLGDTNTTIEYSFESESGSKNISVEGGGGLVDIPRGKYTIRAKVLNKESGDFEAGKLIAVKPSLELNCG